MSACGSKEVYHILQILSRRRGGFFSFEGAKMVKSKIRAALPKRIAEEIDRLCAARKGDFSKIGEIRLREAGQCSVIIEGERLSLFSSLKCGEAELILSRLLEGGMYAYRDSIKNGYVTLFGGVRIGIVGRGGYSDESFVGLSEIRSLIFRIPQGACSFKSKLYEAFLRSECGVLIFSPPGVGKTTALRSLVKVYAERGEEVSVIDERCEFLLEDYSGLSVDIYRGYSKGIGASLALRSSAPTVIAIDEIGGRGEADAVCESLLSGVKIIATAHAKSIDELFCRKSLEPFFSLCAFDLFLGISYSDGVRRAELYGRDGCVI